MTNSSDGEDTNRGTEYQQALKYAAAALRVGAKEAGYEMTEAAAILFAHTVIEAYDPPRFESSDQEAVDDSATGEGQR